MLDQLPLLVPLLILQPPVSGSGLGAQCAARERPRRSSWWFNAQLACCSVQCFGFSARGSMHHHSTSITPCKSLLVWGLWPRDQSSDHLRSASITASASLLAMLSCSPPPAALPPLTPPLAIVSLESLQELRPCLNCDSLRPGLIGGSQTSVSGVPMVLLQFFQDCGYRAWRILVERSDGFRL